MQVTLKLDSQLLLDFFKFLFPIKDGVCRITTTKPLGGQLIYYVRTSTKRIDVKGQYLVNIELPKSGSTTAYLENKWLYYTVNEMRLLNIALKDLFNIDFAAYYHRGEELGYKKKEIIDAYILSRGLYTIDPYDALSKRLYRKQQKDLKAKQSYLLRKAYYIQETIDLTLLK